MICGEMGCRASVSGADPSLVLGVACKLSLASLADGCAVFVEESPERWRLQALAHKDAALEGRIRNLPASNSVLWKGEIPADGSLPASWMDTISEDEKVKLLIEAQPAGHHVAIPVGDRLPRHVAVLLRGNPYEPHDLNLARQYWHLVGVGLAPVEKYASEAGLPALLGAVAHELKAPIACLMGHLDEILQRLRRSPSVPAEALRLVLMKAKDQTRDLARLVDNLLVTSRIEGGKWASHCEPVRLSEAVRAVLDRFRPELERRAICVQIEVFNELPGSWDPIQLQQIATNLLSNAIHYGNGRPICIRIASDAGATTLLVEDQGSGMSDEVRRRLFRPFERGVLGTSHGTGLGLFIVQKIVGAHGGTIAVESAVGAGTSVRIRLPQEGRPAGRHLVTDVARDPVCGMPVPGSEVDVVFGGHLFVFCSELCRRTFLQDPDRFAAQDRPASPDVRRIAYFSMEVGFEPSIPTYAGGLGVLAGDALRAFADLDLPVIGVTLAHRNGYFEQALDSGGNQSERASPWDPSSRLQELAARVHVQIEKRSVVVRAWRYEIRGAGGGTVPLVLLDTDLAENSGWDREITSRLYGGDERYRLAQEIVLGIAGVRMVRALGHVGLDRFHMNEGHSALLAIELLREGLSWGLDYHSVRARCVFTTHTPVPAGHDQFEYPLVEHMLGEIVPLSVLQMLGGTDRLNMTRLALSLSRYVNGVAKAHGTLSQEMFPGYLIGSITNGVHSRTWTRPSFADLFTRHIPGWEDDPSTLRSAAGIPVGEIEEAHRLAKLRLLEEVRRRGTVLSPETLTLGFARRAAKYKRADLVFADPTRLARIAREAGGLQLVFSGKAHPQDEPGREMIRAVFRHIEGLRSDVKIAYLENYTMETAKWITSGVDVWLNTPDPPQEASGTSGMKAAHNGVPSLSVLDGWWNEGHIEGVTGWSIGSPLSARRNGSAMDDADDLYRKLETVVLPKFYRAREEWTHMMRATIALNASYFNAHRMVQQYMAMAYA